MVLICSVDISFRPPFDLLKLEWTLQSVVHGLDDSDRRKSLPFTSAATLIVAYDASAPRRDTPLTACLRSHQAAQVSIQRQYTISDYALAEVGSWAANWVWKYACREIKSSGIERETPNMQVLWDLVESWPAEPPDLDMTTATFNLTPKAVKLVQLLATCESYGKDFRGIVFVRRRVVALALAALIETLNQKNNSTFLRPVAMTHRQSPVAISELIEKLGHGTYNLAFATRSFEDLELPQVNVIIHYDLFDSLITRAYTYTLLREKGHLVYMVQKGNVTHRRIVSRVMRPNSQLQRWATVLSHTPGSSIPPETEDPIDSYHSDSEAEDDEDDVIMDPLTNGRLTQRTAAIAIYRFSSKCFEDTLNYVPLFEFDEVALPDRTGPPSYRCRVLLSGHPEIAWSSPCSSKAFAKREASYSACETLFNAGVLDYRFFPPVRGLEDAQVNLSDLPPLGKVFPGTRTYPKRSPKFWTIQDVRVERLFPILIHVAASDSLPSHAPMLLLCRQPTPDLSAFNIFFSGMPASVQLVRAQPLCLNGQQVKTLLAYSIRVWRLIRNRPYTCSADKIPYFFAPVVWDAIVFRPSELYNLPDVSNAIPWSVASFAASHYAVPMKFGTSDEVAADVVDALIQDRWVEFTRRFEIVKVRSDLTPLSRPQDEASNKQYATILEICKTFRKEFNGLRDENQCLVQAEAFPAFVDRMNPVAPELRYPWPQRYFIPELCAKCTIPASTMRTALLLPCVLQRIEDFLLVKELNSRLLSNAISDGLLHMALTTRAVEIEYDYERLEILGDSILKYMASLYVFVTNPEREEGHLHSVRQNIISNKSLFECSLAVGLPAYIHSRMLNVKNWPPSNFELDTASGSNGTAESGQALGTKSPGLRDADQHDSMPTRPTSGGDRPETDVTAKRPPKKEKRKMLHDQVHWLSDKAIADVSEAIIGAGYLTGGLETALRTAKALKLRMPDVEQWTDFARIADMKTLDGNMKGAREPYVSEVEAIIGHHFERPHFLISALTHTSKASREVGSYNRLEFIGDAILEFSKAIYFSLPQYGELDFRVSVVVRNLFDRNQRSTPGALTMLKGAMVSNSALAAVSVRSGLYRHLQFQASHLSNSIHTYVTTLKQKETEEYSAALREGRSPGQYWHDLEPPKPLADIVESVLGALYLSDDFSHVGVDRFFDRVLRPFYDKHISLETLSHHPTKVLFELIQSKGCQEFKILRDGDDCLGKQSPIRSEMY
ncbi:Dicer-like protein 1 [Marasmius tenuissimus]|uniref:Dicer-like protein 1 n=1 Tax=Marasmius tenuissimus TaxID=585030 RepID=A0ABR3ABW5_9AGAR